MEVIIIHRRGAETLRKQFIVDDACLADDLSLRLSDSAVKGS
jgi:hypothetical protein